MKIYTSKDKFWTDETGIEVPFSRITKLEKFKERSGGMLIKESLFLNEKLAAFKNKIDELSREVYERTMKENDIDPTHRKGNFTWYIFNRDVKIETSIQERIDFDETLIAVAKEKLEQFIKENTNSVEEMIQQLVMDAFSTTRGKLDAKKVLNLLKYKQRIDQKKYPMFHEALDAINNSIRRPESKTYHRIWFKDDKGEYQNVDLNFSSI